MSSAGAPVRQQQLRKVKDYEADLTNLKASGRDARTGLSDNVAAASTDAPGPWPASAGGD